MHPALLRLQKRDPALFQTEHHRVTTRIERQMAPYIDRLMQRTDLSDEERGRRIETLRREIEEQVMGDWMREHPRRQRHESRPQGATRDTSHARR